MAFHTSCLWNNEAYMLMMTVICVCIAANMSAEFFSKRDKQKANQGEQTELFLDIWLFSMMHVIIELYSCVCVSIIYSHTFHSYVRWICRQKL
jgi:uncharacterized membrane protein